jgi:type I restriction enzyme S subunit
MKALLSIKPQYVDKIIKGNKRYEFRKSFCSKENLEKLEIVYIYSSSPVKKIVARFSPNSILKDHPRVLWKKCKKDSGISKEGFFSYFRNKEKGIAIEISNLEIFEKPIDPYLVFPKFTAPQNFYYIDNIEKFIE